MSEKIPKVDKTHIDKFIWQPGTIIITKSPARELVTPEKKK